MIDGTSIKYANYEIKEAPHLNESHGDGKHKELLERQMDRVGGGNDKDYYHVHGEKHGFLALKNPYNTQVLDREINAKASIVEKNGDLAKFFTHTESANHKIYGKGFVTEHINFAKDTLGNNAEFKPKLLGNPISSEVKLKKITSAINNSDVGCVNLINNLKEIIDNIDLLCDHIGELTLAITTDTDGPSVKIIDTAPNEANQTVDDDSKRQIKSGINALVYRLENGKSEMQHRHTNINFA